MQYLSEYIYKDFISLPYRRSIPCLVTSHIFPDFLNSPSKNPFFTRPLQFCLRESAVTFQRSAASYVVITSSNFIIELLILLIDYKRITQRQ